MLPLIYSVSPLIAFGVLNIKNFLEKKFQISSNKILIFLSLYIVIFSFVKIIEPSRKDLLQLKEVAINIADLISDQELKKCSETACTNLVFTREERILFYISSHKKIPLCPKCENSIFYVNLHKLSDNQIVNYVLSKGYKFVILEKDVFKDRTEILKKNFEELGIKTYIIERKKSKYF